MIDYEHGGIYLDVVSTANLRTIMDHRNDPRLNRWFRQVGLLSEWENAAYWQKVFSSDEHKFYEIHDQTNKFCGVCGLTYICRQNQRAEFSAWVRPEIQQRGIGTNALRTLFDHGFDDLNLNLIYGECFDGNPAIETFIKKLWMIYDGERQSFYFKGGKWISAHMISITRDQWKWNKSRSSQS